MLVKLRDNLYLGDKNITADELKKAGVTIILACAREAMVLDCGDALVFTVGLFNDKINKPHVKDIACHIPKYMMQNGETVAVISKTGLVRAAFVASRALCELENKSIYEVLLEVKQLLPSFDIGKAYI